MASEIALVGGAPGNQRRAVKDPTRTRSSDRTRFLISVGFLVGLSWAASRTGYYTPGSDLGYYIGLTGGILMLLLFAYPLRKHVRAMHSWGPAKHWLAVHMFLGIAGPLLILAHSTFTISSINAGVALTCMLVVAGSGIVGRFIYIKIHRGLYGEKLNLKELQAHAGFSTDEVRSKLYFAPLVEQRLKEFEAHALPEYRTFGDDAWRFVTLGMRKHWVYLSCANEMQQIFREHAKARQWDRAKYRRRMKSAKSLVATYLGSIQRVSQFTTYDRLFSLWHVLHVPLMYMLVLSAVAHIVAVHMY